VILLCLISGILLFACPAQAQLNLQTDQIWLTTETEHFVIITDASLKSLIAGLSEECEQAYNDLSELFRWEFAEKPTVIYTDHSDQHNGWANTISHPTMLIIAAPPRNNSMLCSSANYRRRTVYHELTHLLQNDATYGSTRYFNNVFGRVFAEFMDPLSLTIALLTLPPANAAPSWYLEGTAIWAETQFGNSGRGRNSEVDAIFRTSVEQNRLVPGNHWHLREPDWPYGNIAYLYGMKAIHEAALRPADDKPADANFPGLMGDSVAKAPVAGLFNSQISDVSDRNFKTIARDTIKNEIAFQNERIAILEEQPLTRLERWSPLKIQAKEPVWSNDGDLWVAASFNMHRTKLVRIDPNTRDIISVGPKITDNWTKTALDPDTGDIYFTRLDGENGTEKRSYLNRFNPLTGKTHRVIGPVRVADIAVGNNGYLLLVVRSADKDMLQLWKWKDSTRNELVYIRKSDIDKSINSNGNYIISAPVFNPRYKIGTETNSSFFSYLCCSDKGTEILSETFNGNITSCWKTSDSKIRDLSYSPDSPDEYIFCSDINGVFNIYKFNVNQSVASPLTNTLGGVYSCVYSPDRKKAALTGLDADGHFISIVSSDSLLPCSQTLPQLESPWRLPVGSMDHESGKSIRTSSRLSISNYEPLKNLRFDYWTPWLNWQTGYTAGGLMTRWSDRSQSHKIFAYFGHESNQDEWIGMTHWEYLRERPEIDILFSREAPIYSGLIRDKKGNYFDLEEVRWKLTGSAACNWVHADFNARFMSGWHGIFHDVKDSDLWQSAIDGHMIQDKPLLDDFESAVWVSGSFNTFTFYPGSNSVEDGFSADIACDWSDKILGSSINRRRIRGDAAVYCRIPGLETHVLKLSAAYGIAWGNRYAQGAYTVGGYDNLRTGNPPGMLSAMTLRGYESNIQTGNRAAEFAVSYRLPLFNIYRSFSSRSAFYMTQIMGEFFWETASAWDTDQAEHDWYRSMGAEINLGNVLFTHIDLAPGIGFAWKSDGFEKNVTPPGSDNGDWAVYFSLKSTVNL